MKPSTTNTHFDIVIIGGAMTGVTLALAISQLTKNALSIALIESELISQEHQGFDARSIALSYGSCMLLNKLDLWESLSNFATPIKNIHVSDQGHAGITEFNAEEEKLPFLGQVVELADAGEVFYQKLAKKNNVTLFCPAQIQTIERKTDFNLVKLRDNTELASKLVIAADGGQSTSCTMLGISHLQHDFNQVAITSNVTTSHPHQFCAYERFTQQGPVALLPMSRNRSSLVWSVRPEEAARIMDLDKEAFLAKLQHIFGWRLGKLKQSNIPHSYPLVLRQANKLISHRFAVVGNAAQTLHPVAGQGFNLALRDVMTLATEIAFTYQKNRDWGEMTTLQRYRAAREPDRDTIIRLISCLVYGFSNKSLPLIAARNLGLIGMTLCKKLKTPLMRQLMGLSN